MLTSTKTDLKTAINSIVHVLVCGIILSGIISPVFAQGPGEIIGQWKISGIKPVDGRFYSGTVNIRKLQDAYIVEWKTEKGTAIGIGQYEDGTLAVAFSDDKTMPVVVSRYIREPNGKYQGYRVNPIDSGYVSSETLGNGKNDPFTGSYKLTGQSKKRDGKLSGELVTRKEGEVLTGTATFDKQTYQTVGLMFDKDQQAVLAFSAKKNVKFGAAVFKLEKDELIGQIAYPGKKTLALENLKRIE